MMTLMENPLGGLRALVIVLVVIFSANPALSGEEPPVNEDHVRSSSCNPIQTGAVEGFTMDRVYIEGQDYVLSKDIQYYSSRGQSVTRESIKRGCRIKFVLNPKLEIEIMQPEPGQDNDDW